MRDAAGAQFGDLGLQARTSDRVRRHGSGAGATGAQGANVGGSKVTDAKASLWMGVAARAQDPSQDLLALTVPTSSSPGQTEECAVTFNGSAHAAGPH
jgi:hypothetical protein